MKGIKASYCIRLHSPGGVLWKRYSSKFRNIHRKHECWCFFNKVARRQACDFIRKSLQHRFFLVSVTKFWRASILKNICERLLLLKACWGMATQTPFLVHMIHWVKSVQYRFFFWSVFSCIRKEIYEVNFHAVFDKIIF